MPLVGQTSGMGGKAILVAEDDPLVARLVQTLLEAAGYDVTLAADGYQALTLALDGAYDLHLLDVMMPGLTGDRVAGRLLQADGDTRIGFMTGAYGADLVEERGPVLQKPFKDWQLLEFVDALATEPVPLADG